MYDACSDLSISCGFLLDLSVFFKWLVDFHNQMDVVYSRGGGSSVVLYTIFQCTHPINHVHYVLKINQAFPIFSVCNIEKIRRDLDSYGTNYVTVSLSSPPSPSSWQTGLEASILYQTLMLFTCVCTTLWEEKGCIASTTDKRCSPLTFLRFLAVFLCQ